MNTDNAASNAPILSKTIHYCWFGGKPLPPVAERCIESWKKFFPDYEIKRWDETNFDVNAVRYTAQAYKCRKYAFVSDYARFHILYNHGGLYFDTDVQVIKGMEDIVKAGAFMGFEKPEDGMPGPAAGVAAGLGIGANPGLELYREVLDAYAEMDFLTPDGKPNTTTVVRYTTSILEKHGLKVDNTLQTVAGITIYPWEYFCPVALNSKNLQISDRTRSIHLFAGTWFSKGYIIKKRFERLIGKRAFTALCNIKRNIKRCLGR